jgi:hypothetical protein
VIVGRLHFDLEDILTVLADDSGESLLCFSSKLAFWWPGNGSRDRDIKLVASIGCRDGCNMLEICSGNVQSHTLMLNVDLHLVIPGMSGQLTSAGIEVNVNGYCASFPLTGLDIKDCDIRQSLVCPEGILCILVARGTCSAAISPTTAQSSPTVHIKAKTSAINALALTPAQHLSP